MYPHQRDECQQREDEALLRRCRAAIAAGIYTREYIVSLFAVDRPNVVAQL
jgi:hypothetical protein